LGGQRITAEVETEAGVPVLSKIPVVGRLFGNRSKVRDHKILLILVKPTIILQKEREAEAIAAMESQI
jgi:type II secretory pathway component GspD/PulD (secretin)